MGGDGDVRNSAVDPVRHRVPIQEDGFVDHGEGDVMVKVDSSTSSVWCQSNGMAKMVMVMEGSRVPPATMKGRKRMGAGFLFWIAHLRARQLGTSSRTSLEITAVSGSLGVSSCP